MSTFRMDPDWLVFDPSPSKPNFVLPPGAVDSHCHVFGPGDEFPYAPERKYTPGDASKDDLYRLRDFLGFTRSVVVQATCHGSDNSAMVDALIHSNDLARGVASLRPDVSSDEIAQLHDSGVRGVRLNFVRRLVDPKPDNYYHDIVAKITPFGWHVVVYFEASDLLERWSLLTSLRTTVVVDHMGRPDVTGSLEGPEFGKFLQFLDENENVWVKPTGAERLSMAGPPNYDDFVPFARHVVQNYPDRVMWGTDWPHPNLKSHMPDDGKLVDLIERIAPTEELQRKMLVENPDRLYWRGNP